MRSVSNYIFLIHNGRMTAYQESFVANMKFFRKRAGLSQAKLAELCDVSNGTIGNIECGMTKPSFDLIFEIANAVKVPPAELFKTEIEDYILEDKLTSNQFEIVSETVNSAVQTAVSKALHDLKFKIEH